MDLICYTYEGWAPRLRPASPRRDWMDGSPERYAYRCLPLAIANAHGWEVLSPCGFAARWNGGKGADAIEIKVDPGTRPEQAPATLFGEGVLTFHIEGIMRTPPGWNLWVGGPPNAVRDGIAPLGGVIETDWSPYSFTMNWRFTRPGHWIRFEENEPFCFLFPVQRNVLTGVEPKIRPIEEEEGLKDAFETWSRSRNAFQERMLKEPPTAPADKWQKLYYRGVDPHGNPGAADHNAKLRLAPFRTADGAAREWPEACPVAHAAPPPAARPPAIFATAESAPTRSLIANLAADTMTMTLRQIGFDAKPLAAAPMIGLPQRAEAAAPVVAPSLDTEIALRRRDWQASIAERQRGLSLWAGNVLRLTDLGSEEFLDDFYAPGRPVVIAGAMAGWPALERWTPDYLRAAVGSAEIEFQGGRDSSPDFELYKDKHKQRMPFDRYIDLIMAPGRANDAYITAYNSGTNQAALAPLQRDLGTLDRYLDPGEGMMWIGPAGTFTPLHFDLTNNLLAQIIGRKQLVLVPPSETRHLHHRRHVFSDVHDVLDPDRLALYPEARDIRRFEVTLEPGDLLYIPVGWWHQVRSLDFSVMLTYTNFRWPNDAHESFPG